MHARVLAQIDTLDGDGRKGDGGFAQLFVVARHREHASIVHGIARAVHHAHTAGAYRGNAPVDGFERRVPPKYSGRILGACSLNRLRDVAAILRRVQRAIPEFVGFGDAA